MAKDIVSAYRNVCRDLKGLEAYKTVSHSRLKQAHSVVMKGKMPSSIMCYVPLDRAIEDYNLAVDDYNETIQAIDALMVAKVQMEQIIGSMSEAEQIVILMHVEQGMSLREIADKSHYSYGRIRNVAMEIRKKHVTQSANAS
jgi:DNA-directed RNA polymerase specialized sigma24 family protein